MVEPCIDKFKLVGERRHNVSDLLHRPVTAVSSMGNGTCEWVRRTQKGGGEDVLWMVGTADFIEGIYQGVLVLGLRAMSVEIDGGISRRMDR